MYLYTSNSTNFIADSVGGHIEARLSAAFSDYYQREASPNEVASWKNSLRAVADVFVAAGLTDIGIMLEYELPLSSMRLDCILAGRDEDSHDQAVILELKQWSSCEPSDGERVVTFVGGAQRDVLHPSVQAGQYLTFLQDGQTVFHEGEQPVGLSACAFLHNYRFQTDDPLLDSKFSAELHEIPVFSQDDTPRLIEFLRSKLSKGGGQHVLERIRSSKYKPSKKLLDHVGKVVEGRSEYTLLDEQLVVFDRVVNEARISQTSNSKSVILIRGGPGTGKSVIAINLLAALSRHGLNTHYVTGSRAFTRTLQQIVGKRASSQIKFFNSYMKATQNEVDVLICDEAHRIRMNSNSQWTKSSERSNKLQVEELIDTGKTLVFFVDDKQVVRPGEIGSSSLILETAKKHGCNVFDYALSAQFRCAGSEGFINWVTNTLEIEPTANVFWNPKDRFDFQIVESPDELDKKVREKLAQGHTARLTAGFCWPWSDPRPDGTLADDVVVGEFKRPWNAKSNAGRLAPFIPPENLWAYDPRGVDQIGCIYTAQGFEFDYVGVIVGEDLTYQQGHGWAGNKKVSADSVVKRSGDRFVDMAKNTYRVLLTRGIKGCYVYFVDKDTEDFFRARIAK